MDVIQIIKESIMSNPNLTDEIKENILELITIFHTKINYVNLDGFNDTFIQSRSNLTVPIENCAV